MPPAGGRDKVTVWGKGRFLAVLRMPPAGGKGKVTVWRKGDSSRRSETASGQWNASGGVRGKDYDCGKMEIPRGARKGKGRRIAPSL